MKQNRGEAPCKIYEGRIASDGYGRGLRGVTAHRVAYCEANGLDLEDIKGMVVRHKCDNPPCVNPDHLELGTQKDNVRDRNERGRTNMKVTPEQVQEIRDRYVARCPDNGGKALAKEYGISQPQISAIVTGKERLL